MFRHRLDLRHRFRILRRHSLLALLDFIRQHFLFSGALSLTASTLSELSGDSSENDAPLGSMKANPNSLGSSILPRCLLIAWRSQVGSKLSAIFHVQKWRADYKLSESGLCSEVSSERRGKCINHLITNTVLPKVLATNVQKSLQMLLTLLVRL